MNFADIKAELAQAGVDLSPHAHHEPLGEPPAGPIAIIILDRIEDVAHPSYCIHGFASCISCGRLCYLGSQSQALVKTREAWPLCLPCADQHVPPDRRDQPAFNVNDEAGH